VISWLYGFDVKFSLNAVVALERDDTIGTVDRKHNVDGTVIVLWYKLLLVFDIDFLYDSVVDEIELFSLFSTTLSLIPLSAVSIFLFILIMQILLTVDSHK
jgi:hypothetical protein